MTKRIVLCADDYGQADPISRGIIALIQHGRLSATSCMVNTPTWREHACSLLPFQNLIDIGLHLNLTEGKALSKPFIAAYGENLFPVSTLITKALLRRLDASIIQAEYEAQLDQFVQALGAVPRFIDGHQHVHQFPVMREAMVNFYEKRLRPHQAYVRLVNETITWPDYIRNIKKIIIHTMGTHGLKRLLKKHDIPHNVSFSGTYSFPKANQFDTLFPHFLQAVGDKGIIMCHPGLSPSSTAKDRIAEARYHEYQYLASNQFLIDCHVNGVRLERF